MPAAAWAPWILREPPLWADRVDADRATGLETLAARALTASSDSAQGDDWESLLVPHVQAETGVVTETEGRPRVLVVDRERVRWVEAATTAVEVVAAEAGRLTDRERPLQVVLVGGDFAISLDAEEFIALLSSDSGRFTEAEALLAEIAGGQDSAVGRETERKVAIVLVPTTTLHSLLAGQVIQDATRSTVSMPTRSGEPQRNQAIPVGAQSMQPVARSLERVIRHADDADRTMT